MKKQNKPLSKQLLMKIGIFGFGLSLIVLGSLVSTINSISTELSRQKQTAEEQQIKLESEIEAQKLLRRPVVMVKENRVAFPELNITLPYNSVTRTLQYLANDPPFGDGKDTRITSELATDTSELRQMNCTDLVRINFEDGSPYSPWEESAGSVKLANGKTLYIVATKAFKNHEASTEECTTEVWKLITPQQIAEEFKKAESY